MENLNYNSFCSFVYRVCSDNVSIKKKNDSFYVFCSNFKDTMALIEGLVSNCLGFNYKPLDRFCDTAIIVRISQNGAENINDFNRTHYPIK